MTVLSRKIKNLNLRKLSPLGQQWFVKTIEAIAENKYEFTLPLPIYYDDDLYETTFQLTQIRQEIQYGTENYEWCTVDLYYNILLDCPNKDQVTFQMCREFQPM